jgi:hypothetical protein
MEALGDGPREVFPHPRNAAGALSDGFRDAIAQALRAVDYVGSDVPPLRWWLRSWESDAPLFPLMIEGESLGAAFAVGVISLLRAAPVTSRHVVTAGVGSDGRLRPVTDIADKMAAAESAGVVGVVLAQDQDMTAFTVPPAIRCHRMEDVWGVVDLVTGESSVPARSFARRPARPDRTLVSYGERMYLLWGGRRHHVPSPAVLEDLFLANLELPAAATPLPREEIESYPRGPTVMEGGFLFRNSESDLYLVQDGRRRHVSPTSPDGGRHTSERHTRLPDHVIEGMPIGESIAPGDVTRLRLTILRDGAPTEECSPGEAVEIRLDVRGDGCAVFPFLRVKGPDGAVEYVFVDEATSIHETHTSTTRTPARIQKNGEWEPHAVGDTTWSLASFIAERATQGDRWSWEAWVEDANGRVEEMSADGAPTPMGGHVATASLSVVPAAGRPPTTDARPRQLMQHGTRAFLAEQDATLSATCSTHRYYAYRNTRISTPTLAAEPLPDGLLFKGGGPDIYLYQDGQKRPFADSDSFHAHGYAYNVSAGRETFVHLPRHIVDGLPPGPPIETDTSEVRLSLSLRDSAGRARRTFRAGDRVTARLSVVGDGYTAYLHMRVTPPTGDAAYMSRVDDGWVCSPCKTAFDALPTGEWERRSVRVGDWTAPSWTIPEDGSAGEWVCEAWLENVNVAPGADTAVHDEPMPISGTIARAAFEIVARS